MDETNDYRRRVLGMFDEMGKESLDLHELFEAGGNDPEARTAVFHAVEDLVEEGLLEALGNDFYALTAEGRRRSDAQRTEGSGESRSGS